MKTYNYIYKITNQINGKIYIGKHSTDNLDDGYMGSGILICKAEKKYGIENFTKEYLAFCDTEEKLNWFEKFYIKKYKAREVGYNLTDGGDGTLGRKQTEETKRKLSEATKKRLAEKGVPFKGKHLSLETIQKISGAMKCKTFSEEHKQKLRKPKQKFNWLTPTGEIKTMNKAKAKQWHPDWKLIEQV